ncbi:hypothetical protein [Microbacterium lacticum]|nr:hypothetical protein [Microbacterium lacticum]
MPDATLVCSTKNGSTGKTPTSARKTPTMIRHVRARETPCGVVLGMDAVA